jgi:uncharacterized membrane protein
MPVNPHKFVYASMYAHAHTHSLNVSLFFVWDVFVVLPLLFTEKNYDHIENNFGA